MTWMMSGCWSQRYDDDGDEDVDGDSDVHDDDHHRDDDHLDEMTSDVKTSIGHF